MLHCLSALSPQFHRKPPNHPNSVPCTKNGITPKFASSFVLVKQFGSSVEYFQQKQTNYFVQLLSFQRLQRTTLYSLTGLEFDVDEKTQSPVDIVIFYQSREMILNPHETKQEREGIFKSFKTLKNYVLSKGKLILPTVGFSSGSLSKPENEIQRPLVNTSHKFSKISLNIRKDSFHLLYKTGEIISEIYDCTAKTTIEIGQESQVSHT